MPRIHLTTYSMSPQKRGLSLATKKRLYNTPQWLKLRKSILFAQPVCNVCQAALSEDVDHITPFLSGANDEQVQLLFFDFSNLQGICKKCHREKHRCGNRQNGKMG